MPTKNNWKIFLANSVICRHENNNAYLGSGRLLLVRGEGGFIGGITFKIFIGFGGHFQIRDHYRGGGQCKKYKAVTNVNWNWIKWWTLARFVAGKFVVFTSIGWGGGGGGNFTTCKIYGRINSKKKLGRSWGGGSVRKSSNTSHNGRPPPPPPPLTGNKRRASHKLQHTFLHPSYFWKPNPPWPYWKTVLQKNGFSWHPFTCCT